MVATSKISNGAKGFAASLCFLVFVNKFNQVISNVKRRRNVKKAANVDNKLQEILYYIFIKTCNIREIVTFLGLCSCLVMRTFGSVWVSNHWGKIVSSIVERRFDDLKQHIIRFAGVTIGLAFLNALLKYYIVLLKTHIREKITLWVHKEYMKKGEMIYYKANKVGELKIDNTDHRITSDIDKFSDIFASVLSQSLKPIVDFVVYSVELASVQGLTTPVTLYCWFGFASALSTVTMPPFSELAALEQKLEGRFIAAHSDLITNCEQIAFLGGEKPELRNLNEKFEELRDHNRNTSVLSFKSEVLRQYLNKYFVTVIGLVLVSRPLRLLKPGFEVENMSDSAVSQYFVSMWRNMESMSVSIQDLFELTNRIGRLSGLAQRVKALMIGVESREPILVKEIETSTNGSNAPLFKKGDILKFENVAVHRPDGTLLVHNLNLTVEKGQRVLITGPNGCGKSSLFRVIRKLWPLTSGTITMPEEKEIYFLTQVNFVPLGTLRDLVTYPHDSKDMVKYGRTDEDVKRVLKWATCSPEIIKNGRAQLEFTVSTGEKVRPELDDYRDWGKDLSPGQKQKIAFARLFYHCPKFVVLDECTNGISPDVEKKLYDKCTELDMSIFSISHKIELKEFHDYELHYHGDVDGGYDLLPCSETRGRYLGA